MYFIFQNYRWLHQHFFADTIYCGCFCAAPKARARKNQPFLPTYILISRQESVNILKTYRILCIFTQKQVKLCSIGLTIRKTCIVFIGIFLVSISHYAILLAAFKHFDTTDIKQMGGEGNSLIFDRKHFVSTIPSQWRQVNCNDL